VSLVIAHRGASGYEYENSRAAFRAARARGADAIELDIHAAADGVLFVHHDEVVSGVHITRSSAAQVRALRLPNGESIPALEDALAVIDPRCRSSSRSSPCPRNSTTGCSPCWRAPAVARVAPCTGSTIVL